ncbi:MAG: SRPBCC family protein [Chitinophagaceae bacterium]
MKFIKLAIISIVILFCIVTIIGLIFPGSVTVSRAININAPHDSVYHLLTDIKYWKLWMEGAEKNTIQFLSNKTAGAGTVAKIGATEVSIENATPSHIETIWKDSKGNKQTGVFNLITDSSKQITTVQWYFEQQLKWYPWERIGSMMNEKILAPSMENDLENLKKLAEKNR